MTLCVSFKVPSEFREYISPAVCRLGYLHPELEFRASGDSIQVKGSAEKPERLRRDVFHVLYREKLASQSLEVKTRLILELTAP